MQIVTKTFGTRTVEINKRLKGLNSITEDIIRQLCERCNNMRLSNLQREQLHAEIREQLLK